MRLFLCDQTVALYFCTLVYLVFEPLPRPLPRPPLSAAPVSVIRDSPDSDWGLSLGLVQVLDSARFL